MHSHGIDMYQIHAQQICRIINTDNTHGYRIFLHMYRIVRHVYCKISHRIFEIPIARNSINVRSPLLYPIHCIYYIYIYVCIVYIHMHTYPNFRGDHLKPTAAAMFCLEKCRCNTDVNPGMCPKNSRDSPIQIQTLVVANLCQNKRGIFNTKILHLPAGFCPMMVAASLTPWL